jgi:Flagellar hook-associated protein FlgK helical domain
VALARAAGLSAAAIESAALARVRGALAGVDLAFVPCFGDFIAAASELSKRPDCGRRRRALLRRLEDTVLALRASARSLAGVRRSLHGRLLALVDRANALLIAIAGAAHGGTSTVALQGTALRELAALLDLRVATGAGGSFDLSSASGDVLVVAAHAARLEIGSWRASAASCAPVYVRPDGTRHPLTSPLGGEVGALLDLETGWLPRWADALDRLARALRDALNRIHADVRARDQDGYPAGDLLCGSGASDLAAAVCGPRAIAAERETEPGGENARLLWELGSSEIAELAGGTIGAFARGLGATVEQACEAATRRASSIGRGLENGQELPLAVWTG